MTDYEALQFFIAARDNPVVAAWISVLHENRLPAGADIHPHDHWSAIEQLESHGYIPLSMMTDIEELMACAWAPPKPDHDQIHDALHNLKLLLAQESESHMTRAKPPLEAFSPASSLTTRNQGELTTHEPMPLGQRRPPEEFSAFSPAPREMPSRHLPAFPDAFSPRALDCVTGEGDERTLNVQLTCQGGSGSASHRPTVITLEDDGTDELESEQLPSGMGKLIEYQFHGECTECGTVFHFSAGKPVSADAYKR